MRQCKDSPITEGRNDTTGSYPTTLSSGTKRQDQRRGVSLGRRHRPKRQGRMAVDAAAFSCLERLCRCRAPADGKGSRRNRQGQMAADTAELCCRWGPCLPRETVDGGRQGQTSPCRPRGGAPGQWRAANRRLTDSSEIGFYGSGSVPGVPRRHSRSAQSALRMVKPRVPETAPFDLSICMVGRVLRTSSIRLPQGGLDTPDRHVMEVERIAIAGHKGFNE